MLRFISVNYRTHKTPHRFQSVLTLRSYSIKPIDKILIANRGEIACRVISTARKLGIKSVAVYSDADAKSRHVSMADESYRIGPPAATESYLRGDIIIQVAKQCGADAIHPGYGFLSENEHFARDVEANGITFIGPPPTAIHAMGSKSASKEIMINADVPVVPGYHGENQDLEHLAKEAEKIGYPVLLKAVLGGGGKGMRIVDTPDQLPEALDACRREALASFKDDRVLVEKYITKPRHVEIQVFADSLGDCVYLFERDCSVQRRHQKVIEEAPAPHLTPEFRAQMGTAAVNAARAVGYRGAGTVEFIYDVDAEKFYFMEMNTRLQVEHPITEMITKQDLVEWQIRVAEGHKLPLSQDELAIHGHAFEARIYAENPDKGFLPGTGTLEYHQPPETGENVRVDTGVLQGDEVSVFYDPMIAKLVVWDKDRNQALRRLINSLQNYHIAGLQTNIQFLIRLASHPEFKAGNVDTGFIKRYESDLIKPEAPFPPPFALALAELGQILKNINDQKTIKSEDPYSPWNLSDGHRLNHAYSSTTQYTSEEKPYTTTTTYKPNHVYDITITEGDKTFDFKNVTGKLHNGQITATLNGERVNGVVVTTRDGNVQVMYRGQHYTVTPKQPNYNAKAVDKGSLVAPMPGKIIKIFVKEGDKVKQGAPLLILEAMKMEHKITSPTEGIVKSIHYAVGDLVEHKANLVVIQPN